MSRGLGGGELVLCEVRGGEWLKPGNMPDWGPSRRAARQVEMAEADPVPEGTREDEDI